MQFEIKVAYKECTKLFWSTKMHEIYELQIGINKFASINIIITIILALVSRRATIVL